MTIKKIISIKNVGRFKNSTPTTNNPQWAKHTLIFGANGYGKTTICAVFRSALMCASELIIGRKTLGVNGEQSIDLLCDNGTIHFDGANWSEAIPHLAIFDSVFVAENIHSGDIVELEHRRNLYRVIIGHKGLLLAEEDTKLTVASRAKTLEITAADKLIRPDYIDANLTINQYLELEEVPDIDDKITKQEIDLNAIRQAIQIQNRPSLSTLTIPIFPDQFGILLAHTIDDVAEDAEQKMNLHLEMHKIIDQGETWLAKGMQHITDGNCPFCGQDVSASTLIASYRGLFGDAYATFKSNIASLRTQVLKQLSDVIIGNLTTQSAQNDGNIDFWKQYCVFDSSLLELPDTSAETISMLRNECCILLDRKANSPLDSITLKQNFDISLESFVQLSDTITVINAALEGMNVIISAKKSETSKVTARDAENELTRLKAAKKRFAIGTVKYCADYNKLVIEKAVIEKAKETNRLELNIHTDTVMGPYASHINKYLDDFNAGFSITNTTHSFPGGIATSSYQLVINQTHIDVGNERTLFDTPSFKNTLSAGDRNTLALAFFLVQLKHDTNLASKIVVFDDPFNSQDAFRRLQTVHEIKWTGKQCAQVIVLSHDADFLLDVWNQSPHDSRVSLQLSGQIAHGTKIAAHNLETACRERVTAELHDLLSYRNEEIGAPLDIVKKMRIVLESFCRNTYASVFHEQDNLGTIIKNIRDIGDQHPACDLLDALDLINEYSCKYHHGDDSSIACSRHIDVTELRGFVDKTLKIVNAF